MKSHRAKILPIRSVGLMEVAEKDRNEDGRIRKMRRGMLERWKDIEEPTEV